MSHETLVRRIGQFVSRVPGVDAQAVVDAVRMRRAHRKIEAAFEQILMGHGMSPRLWGILEALYHHPDRAMTPAELADAELVTRSAMTGYVDALERVGYVARRPHPSDRRMISVALTPQGKRFLDGALVEHYRDTSMVASYLDPEERRTMLRLYEKVGEAVRGLLEAHAHDTADARTGDAQ